MPHSNFFFVTSQIKWLTEISLAVQVATVHTVIARSCKQALKWLNNQKPSHFAACHKEKAFCASQLNGADFYSTEDPAIICNQSFIK